MSPEERTVESAIALLTAANLVTVKNFYRNFENTTAIGDEASETKQGKPCVVIQFNANEEAFPQSGIIIGDLNLTVCSNASATTADTHASMKGEVYNAIYTTDLPDRLTGAVEHFRCYGFAGAVNLSHRRDGSDWESTISIPLSVFAATIPDS